MSQVREAIRDATRLARMRMGQEAPEMVDIPSMPGIRLAMVPLTEAETQSGLILAAALDVLDNAAGLQARNRIVVESDVWHSLREPQEPETRIYPSVEEMTLELGSGDIDRLHERLSMLMDYSSPAMDGFTDQELNDLKKAFGETDWSALTGKRWAAVKTCISVLSPELLAVKLFGSGSTDSATPTSANEEST